MIEHRVNFTKPEPHPLTREGLAAGRATDLRRLVKSGKLSGSQKTLDTIRALKDVARGKKGAKWPEGNSQEGFDEMSSPRTLFDLGVGHKTLSPEENRRKIAVESIAALEGSIRRGELRPNADYVQKELAYQRAIAAGEPAKRVRATVSLEAPVVTEPTADAAIVQMPIHDGDVKLKEPHGETIVHLPTKAEVLVADIISEKRPDQFPVSSGVARKNAIANEKAGIVPVVFEARDKALQKELAADSVRRLVRAA